jgi:uncharacterized protein (TIGR02284 family)
MRCTDTIKVLGELIRVAEDGEKGFAAAAEDATKLDLRTLLEKRSIDCGTALVELRRLLQSLGGSDTLEASGGHSGWTETRTAFGDTNLRVLEDAERAEDKAEASYAKAMSITFSHQIRSVLQNQHDGTVRNHELILSLRDSYRAVNDTVRS